MFIAFEGGDGVGKSTQIHLLRDFLQQRGYSVLLCREPGSTQLGERIRDILLNQKSIAIDRMSELLLFMAARSQLTREVILPALERGEVVLADRFLMSSIVYQGYAGGLDIEQLRTIGRIATANVEPDCTIILDAPVETGRARRSGTTQDRLESENDAFHQRVREGFLAEAALFPEKTLVLSAVDSIENIQERIRQHVTALLASQACGE